MAVHLEQVSTYYPEVMQEADRQFRIIHGSEFDSLADYYKEFVERLNSSIQSGNEYGTDELIRYYLKDDTIHDFLFHAQAATAGIIIERKEERVETCQK